MTHVVERRNNRGNNITSILCTNYTVKGRKSLVEKH